MFSTDVLHVAWSAVLCGFAARVIAAMLAA
jgi:hypothetical protein